MSEETSALKNLNHIHSAIQRAVEQNQAVFIPESEVKPGIVCLAKFTDSDGMSCYYRARVDEVYTGEDNGVRAQVFCLCASVSFPFPLLMYLYVGLNFR